MKKYVLLAVAVMMVATSSVLAAPTDTGHLVVLMYHRFDAGGQISIPMSEFRRQIEYLQENDYHFVSMDELLEHVNSGEPFPTRSVMVTVDDGYVSTYTHAYPYLKEQGIPWVLYVYTEAVEKGYASTLTWGQIREMARNGVTVGNHTYSHGRPTSGSFRDGDWVEREIRAPHRLIEQKVGDPVRSFAIPYGEYDTTLMNVLKEEFEYPVVWGIDPGVVDPSDPAPVLSRFGVNDSTTWKEFKKKLNRLPLAVESVQPGGGERLSQGDTIHIELRHPKRYQNSPVNLFLSELGALNWSWSEDGRRIVARVERPLTEPWNRIILTVLDPEFGRYRFFSRGMVTKTLR